MQRARRSHNRPNQASRRGRVAWQGGRSRVVEWWTVGTTVVVAALVVLLALGAHGAFRADHDYLGGVHQFEAEHDFYRAHAGGPAVLQRYGQGHVLNPWEPTYPAYQGDHLRQCVPARLQQLAGHQRPRPEARRLLADSLAAEEPLMGTYSASEAQVDLELALLQPSSAKPDLAAAAALAREAVKDNPRESGEPQPPVQNLDHRP